MHLARVFFFGLVSLAPAVVCADLPDDGNFLSYQSESQSWDDQGPAFDNGVDLALAMLAGPTIPCDPDTIQYSGKLRARSDTCDPTSRTKASPKSNVPIPNNDDGYGMDGKRLDHYPKVWESQPTRPPPLKVTPSESCAKSEIGAGKYHICHEGPRSEVQKANSGLGRIATQILNAIYS
ncbi:hypothetical protein MMC07_008945 [Pseudocyphellaria aurata]|nr:hypothetical protein [Pseudocyphellaria aurata]